MAALARTCAGPARGRCGTALRGPVVARGFSLMEMLVTLVLVSFTTMLMFQMLGSYRIAHERVRQQSGFIDRNALFQAWFRDSVHGLYIAEGLTFEGSGDRIVGTTLNPLYAAEGAPTRVAWRLQSTGDRVSIRYLEDGRERWRSKFGAGELVRFTYLTADGQASDVWPPKVGKVDTVSLPAVVVLVRQARDREHVLAAAVLGPLVPPKRLYGDEEIE